MLPRQPYRNNSHPPESRSGALSRLLRVASSCYRPFLASPQEILSALRSVQNPGFNRDIVSIGLTKDIEIASQGVTVMIAPTTRDTQVIESIRASIEDTVRQMNVGPVSVRVEKPTQPARSLSQNPGPRSSRQMGGESGKGGVIVTTPQDVALLDVKRAITMFNEIEAPVLGVVENMSYHVCSGCAKRAEIFAHGGGARIAEQLGVPFLGEVPLHRAVRSSGDNGQPIVTAAPVHPAARAIRDIPERVASLLSDPASAS